MNRFTQKLLKTPPLSRVFKTPWIGIYPNFAAALAAIPEDNRIGYNQEETKAVFSQVPTTRVRSADYPILLHLRNLLKPVPLLLRDLPLRGVATGKQRTHLLWMWNIGDIRPSGAEQCHTAVPPRHRSPLPPLIGPD